MFDDDGKPRAAKPDGFTYVGGSDTWEALTAGETGGDADGDGVADPWTLIQARQQFTDAAAGRLPVKRLAGVFEAATTANQARGGDAKAAPYVVPRNENVPTLAEMTRAALAVLDQDPDGFVLMVEGGAVDWAAHDNQTGRMIEELEDFGQAVGWSIGVRPDGTSPMRLVAGDVRTPAVSPDGSQLVVSGWVQVFSLVEAHPLQGLVVRPRP